MLNPSLYIYLSFLLPFWAQSQDLSKINLKGNVRYVQEESFEGVRRDSTIYKSTKNRQYAWLYDNSMEFDRSGKLIYKNFYDDDKKLLFTERYVYRENKILKKYSHAFHYSYSYNALGLVCEESVASKDDSTELKLRQRFRHDENGLLTDIWEFDMQGSHVRYQQNTYDAKKRIVKEVIKYSDGTEFKNYTYNLDGLLEKIEWFDQNTGLLETTTYTYYGRRLYKVVLQDYEDGKLESTTETRYDKFENPVYILETNVKRRIREEEKISYVYDVGDNWVKRISSINDSQFFIVERQIRYYL